MTPDTRKTIGIVLMTLLLGVGAVGLFTMASTTVLPKKDACIYSAP